MPEPGGSSAVGYGDFAREPIEASASAADMRRYLKADRPSLGSKSGRPDADGPLLGSAGPLLLRIDAAVCIPRSMAAKVITNEPCRVTTQGYRMS